MHTHTHARALLPSTGHPSNPLLPPQVLARDVVYEMVPQDVRRDWHAATAAAMEAYSSGAGVVVVGGGVRAELQPRPAPASPVHRSPPHSTRRILRWQTRCACPPAPLRGTGARAAATWRPRSGSAASGQPSGGSARRWHRWTMAPMPTRCRCCRRRRHAVPGRLHAGEPARRSWVPRYAWSLSRISSSPPSPSPLPIPAGPGGNAGGLLLPPLTVLLAHAPRADAGRPYAGACAARRLVPRALPLWLRGCVGWLAWVTGMGDCPCTCWRALERYTAASHHAPLCRPGQSGAADPAPAPRPLGALHGSNVCLSGAVW